LADPKITSFTVFVLMNNSSIIFSNTGRLSGGGTQNPGTLSGRTELMVKRAANTPREWLIVLKLALVAQLPVSCGHFA
jgi:hypothetical protein